jgi:amino acid adenylation domain-containing protein
LVRRERETALGAYGHQEAPFEKLVEELNPDRDLSRNPLFQVMMALQNTRGGQIEISGLKVKGAEEEQVERRDVTAKFDLTLNLLEVNEGLAGSLEYSRDLYEAATIRRMARHYQQVVEAIVRDADQRIREIELMTEAERSQIVEEWNQTEREYGECRLAHRMISAQAARGPEAVAVVCGDEHVSYCELDEQSGRLAGYLRRLGVGPEVRVGICLERSVEMVVGLLGILKTGGAYVPLDPGYPAERLAYMLDDSGARLLLTQQRLLPNLPSQTPDLLFIDERQDREQEVLGDLESGSESENAACVIYTSGSTGKPKGVVVPHRAVFNQLAWTERAYRLSDADRVIHKTSYSFDPSILEIFLPLTVGAQIVIARPGGERDIDYLLRTLVEQQITYLDLVPSLLQTLLSSPAIKSCHSLRLVVSGSEPLASHLVEIFQRTVRATLCNAYGPTETTVQSTFTVCLPGAETSVSIGRPIANTQAYVLDEDMKPVPVGVAGELHIGGLGLTRGYLNQPAVTGERFAPNPFCSRSGERLYRTGDRVKYGPDGNLYFLGRRDEQVKVRGYRIELGEIEAALNEHPSVRQGVVVVRENERGGRRLVGYVVGEEGVRTAELMSYLKKRLPDYMAPEAIQVLEEMPLTANGKIDRKRLPSEEDKRRQPEQGNAGARTPVEEIVVGIFENVLKLDRVGREDNFFEIGGHSLLATQVISRVRGVFGVEIGVRSIFEKPTVESLASRIAEGMRSGEKDPAPPLVRVSRDLRLPLSFAQRRLWFIDQLMPNNPYYNIPEAVRMEGKLDYGVLERVVNEIIRRHEVLRTRFEEEEGEPVQAIDPWEGRSVEVINLADLSPEERVTEARRIAEEESRTGFDLTRGPLLRVKALRLQEEEQIVLFTMHHIVSDEWSMEILSREVGALYRAYIAGESSPLSELPIQYADFAVWQRARLQGEALERELEYWRRQLAGMEFLELPTDYPRPAVRSYRGAGQQFALEAELTRKLRVLGQREGTTMFMTLLAGFDIVMSRYSGQNDVAVGTDIANRNRAEIEGLIGFFVNQLVLRVEVRARESFRELLARVREVCLGAYAHQDVPFEKLVEELQPERDLSRAPLFQAKLIWQNAPRETLELGGARLSGVGDIELQTTRLDLTVSITDVGSDLIGGMTYSRDIFEEETIERLMRHYTNVLKEIVEKSERPVCELSLLSDEEREQIVVEWNQTGKSYPQDVCLHELFAAQAERTPERIALISEGRQLSYREMNRRANQLGNYLRGLGVGPEVVVGLCLERSVEMVVGLLGTLKAGGAYLPLDPEAPLERLGYMLEDAGVGVALTQRNMGARLPAFLGQTVLMDEEWEKIAEENEGDPKIEVEAENLAYLIYTSGSTGRPKGVMVRHRSLVNYTHEICRKLGLLEEQSEGGLRFATVSTITADLGNTCIYPSLVSGGCLHVLSYEVVTDGARFEEYVRRDPIDALKIAPSHLSALLSAQPRGAKMLPGRYLILGGEALTPELVEGIRERDATCVVINHYGPTETTIGSLTTRVCEDERELRRRSSVPIGRPIANTEAHILGRELTPAPKGARGELYISGDGVARGYWRRPELTAERFIPNLFACEEGDRLYRTGDVCRYLSDGKIEFLGRADDQVKVRGYRIELGEIEAVLRAHPMVKQCVVVAREVERGDKRLLGYVVGEDGMAQAELSKYVRERLPEYMAPEAILLLEEMPVNANGKIDRKRLPLPNDGSRRLERTYAGARTPVEEIVVGIFEEVLQIDRVGRDENFFEIGGHSLLATRVVSRLRNTFGIEIGVGSIFEKPTVAGLADKIEAAMRSGEKDETPPLVRVEREGQKGARLPLSFAQQRLWFLDQLAPNSPLYNNPYAVRLEGKLDLEILERVINEITRRHEALRTRFEAEAGEPAQVVDPWEPRRLEVVNLTGLPPEEKEIEARRIAGEEAATGFDLSRGSLLRVKVLKLTEEEHVVLFTMSHIVSDGWSMRILSREVGMLYRAFIEGSGSGLEELPIQYADFAVWQRRYLAGGVMEAEVRYWKEQLEGAAVMELPADRARPAMPSYRGGRERVEIGKEVGEGLKRLSQREGATLFMTLMAAFKALMMRYSGEEDLSVGTVIANRTRREIEGLIGFFVNTLVMRTDLSGNPSFRELIAREREVALRAYAHQEAPFEKLVEEINPQRDLSRNPLFQVMMALQNAGREELNLPGLKMSGIEGETGAAIFDLALNLNEGGDGIWGVLEYSQDLYEGETIRRMARHYEHALEEVVRDAERRVGEIELLSDQEKEQVLLGWNGTASPYPEDRCIHHLFEQQMERTPEAVAVVSDEGAVSYRELNRRANQLAHYLQRLGVGPEVMVGVCLERSVEIMVGLLGVLKAGGAYLPLDPTYPAERLSFILEDAAVELIVTQEKLGGLLGMSSAALICIDSDREEIARESEEDVESEVKSEDLAYVIYTSGSTGRPKGTMITHRSVVNLVTDAVRKFRLEPGSKFLQFASLGFDVAVEEIYPVWSIGGSVALPGEDLLYSYEDLARTIERHEVTTIELPTAYWREWMREMSSNGRRAPRSLDLVIMGGERVSPEILKEWKEHGISLLHVYGVTEVTVTSTVYLAPGELYERENLAEIPVGLPMANTEVYLLDGRQQLAPLRIPGEMYLGGAGLARGYLKRPELTAERFVPSPFGKQPGERLYKSGDLARFSPEGWIEFIGRADTQVKLRGYRIELGEIESQLARHPAIKEAVALVREDNPGDKRLVAYYTLAATAKSMVEAETLRGYLSSLLPEYMIPAAYVELESLPLTSNGKLNRRALPAPGLWRAEERGGYLPPRTSAEEILIGILEDVLKLDRVGIRDNFFELGGHSLLATQVISRVRNAFAVEIGVGSIFEMPTVKRLASRIEEAMRAGESDKAPPLVKAGREGQSGDAPAKLPLSFAQQRLWFIDQLEPGKALYNIPGAVRLEGRLDLEALERVVNEIVRRHEVLRTRFVVEEGESGQAPMQVIDEWEPRKLEIRDLRGTPLEEREEEVYRIARAAAETSFDLSRGPLMKVEVLKLEEEQHVLLYTMHHIVSDEWSMTVLTDEVTRLYAAYSRGEESPLEELEIQYGDFAVWQRQWLKGEALERELEYWRKQLRGVEALELPADHPRPAARSYRGARWPFVIPRDVTEKLRRLGQRESVTMFMTLLGGFDALMSRYSGQEDVAIGTDIANRNRAETERLIGFFVNQLVLRVEMRAGESFRELLRRVREACLGAYAHQDVPFEKLVEELQPERDLSRSPLFQAKLIWQDVSREVLELEGMRLRGIGTEVTTTRLDLTVAITDVGSDLVGAVTYSRDLFEAETIERLMGHFVNVLSGIVEEGERPICELSLLSDQEREQIVVEWNQTGRAYPEDRRIHELFREQAERTPDRLALVCGGQQLSYRELNRRANQLAHYLKGLGIGPEVMVGLCLERSVQVVVAILGVLKSGGAYLPLDPESPLERLALMLEDAGAGVVLTERSLEARLPAFWGQTVLLDEEWARIHQERESEPGSEVLAGNPAYVIYTSGSTGKPKGVMVGHRNLVNYTHHMRQKLGVGEGSGERGLRYATVSTITADLGNTCIYPSLVSGGCLHVLSYEAATDGMLFEEYLRNNPIDVLKIVPSHLGALLGSQPGQTTMLPNQYLILGGEGLSNELVDRIRERGAGCEVINHYGPTETTVGSLTSSVSEREEKRRTVTAPIGRPIANTEVYVLDREMMPAPVGVRGELYIAGAGVARGYWGRPELTADRFIPNRLGPRYGDRLYRTGDVCRYLPEGEIEFVGRADYQVKARGYRIELGEIESALAEHGSVRQSVVVSSGDERGAKRLIGYVVVEEGTTGAELKNYVRERLPEYMVPDAIVALEEIPITANGKVDRKKLPAVEGAGRQSERAGDGMRTPVEEILAGIFEEVLKLDRVGRDDNFFELGGHSLLATQVISRARNTFGVEIGVGSIFEAATVKGLASRIEEAVRAGEVQKSPPLVRVGRNVRLPLSFAQQRLWFLVQLVPNDPFYNCPHSLRLEGKLDLEALERSISEIVRRHEVLRTRYEVEDGKPVQVIDEWKPRRLEVEDLKGLGWEEREEEARRIASEEAKTGFDLSQGPLLRVKALELREDDHVVLFTMHHIVSDAWSTGILIREVGTLYQAYITGDPSPLPELEIQYADYAVWQRNYLQGDVLERQLSYWREQLAEIEPLELPLDYPRPALATYQGAGWNFELSKELTGELQALSRRDGVTLFITLLAAFQTLLARYSGQEKIAVGAPIANRTRAETEGLIGFFTNTLVLRTEVVGKLSFRELLGRARKTTLGAFAQQDMPFERLVEELQPDRSLNVQPLFQVMFVLHNAPSPPLELSGVRVGTFNVQIGTSKFDLLLSMREEGDRLTAVIEYNTDLFKESTIERMSHQFETLLEGLAADPDRQISGVPILSQAERWQLLVEWNQTQAAKPAQRHIVEMFEHQVEQTPDAIAVSFHSQSLTYEQLNRSANQLAHYLRRLGAGPEVPVGICLERSIQTMICVLGTLKAAAAYVPIDPANPGQRVAYMLEDSQVKVVLTQESLLETLKQQPVQSVCLDSCWPEIRLCNQGNPQHDRGADYLVYLTYTSGSTGKPKGIAMTVRPLVNLLEWMLEAADVPLRARTVQFASLSFDVSFQDMFSTWLSGGTLVLLSEEERQEIGQLWKALNEQGVERIYIPAVALQQLAEGYCRQPEIKPPLRRVIAGSEQLHITQAIGRMFREARHTRLSNEYGPSETHVVTALEMEQEVEKWEPRPCIGRPIWNTQIYIVDKRMEPVAIGVPGELYIGGEGVARGYWQRPELTAERFVPDPYSVSAGTRLYRTGDVARYKEDGKIEFLGRKDHQIKIRGYRVELGEIESELAQHPKVKEVVVTVCDRAEIGKMLVAYLVVEKDSPVNTSELRSYLGERVPGYMLPSSYVMLEEMPLNSNGKVDRGKLPEPEQSRPELEQKYEGPETATQRVMAKIWEEVLGIEQVGIKDNFFELGGHSLLATQVVSRLKDAFQVEIALRSLFESPTVEGLVEKMVQLEQQTGDFEEIAHILLELEHLSEDEARIMLVQEQLTAEQEP